MEKPSPDQPKQPVMSLSGMKWTHYWLAGAVIVLLTLLVYIPGIQGDFVWDDNDHLINNIVLKENGLYRVWFTTESYPYYPVVWTSFWMEYQLWGLNPTGYHIVNVLVHAASALLIWHILIRLKVPGAWLVAVVFAVHPVNVESVAWITQRKNTLSLFFFLVALLWYFRFDDHGRRGTYWLALASFLLAMLSKVVVVALPVVLLMCVWWLRDTISRRDLLRSLPFFAVSAVMSVVEIWFEYVKVMGDEVVRDDSFFARLAGAGWVVWFYLYKALLPINLTFVYPRWEIDPANGLSYIPALVLLGLLVLCWRYRHSWGQPLLFALGYYVVMLLPVLGFFNSYFMRYSLVADHYQYASIIGIIALAVAVGWRLLQRFGPIGDRLAYVAGASVLVVLGLLTWQQAHIYKDRETLWQDTLQKNPDAWMAHSNLGIVLRSQGRLEEAISHYRQALRIKPDYAEAHNNLGLALGLQGRLEEAISHHRQAVQIEPDYAIMHSNLGTVLRSQGKLEEAISHYRQALRIKPDDAILHNNLGLALGSQGRLEEAISHFRQAIQIKPNYAEAHSNLGVALIEQSHIQEAMVHYSEALRIKPNYAEAHYNLGLALDKLGKIKEAMVHYSEALRINPNLAEVHYNLGLALGRLGKLQEAMGHFSEAFRIRPDYAEAHNNLGVAYYTLGKLDDAIREFKTAVELNPQYSEARDNLEIAYREKGEREEY